MLAKIFVKMILAAIIMMAGCQSVELSQPLTDRGRCHEFKLYKLCVGSYAKGKFLICNSIRIQICFIIAVVFGVFDECYLYEFFRYFRF